MSSEARSKAPGMASSAADQSARLRRRYASERRFRAAGFLALSVSALFLALLLGNMLWKGLGGFTRTEAAVTVDFARSDLMLDPAALTGGQAREVLGSADLEGVLSTAAIAEYGADAEELFGAAGARALGRALTKDPTLLQRSATLWLPVGSKADVANKTEGDALNEKLVAEIDDQDKLRRRFNSDFLTAADATDPSAVGIWGALKGSFLTIIVTMLLAFPIGALSAVYLEEFARRNRWTDLIAVSINNLAAVPSTIFGLLGLAVFLNFMHCRLGAPLVGGLTLALMTMPVIVIAGRKRNNFVPPSRSAMPRWASARRRCRLFPPCPAVALPGILPGTIIGMARALGGPLHC